MRINAIAIVGVALIAGACGASAGQPTWTFAPEHSAEAAPLVDTVAAGVPAASPSPSVSSSAAKAALSFATDIILTPSAPTPAAPVNASIRIADFAFGPASAAIRPGGRVTWTNVDGDRHSILLDGAESGRLDQGATFRRTFATAGTFSYVCGIHSSMKGTIVVVGAGAARAVVPGAAAGSSPNTGPTSVATPAAGSMTTPTASPDDEDEAGRHGGGHDEDHSGHGRGGDDRGDDEDHSGHGGG